MRNITKRFDHGVALVEVVIGVAIVGIVIAFISYSFGLFVNASGRSLERTQAMYLAEEGMEVLRSLRDSDWTTFGSGLSLNTTYYLDIDPTTLTTTGTPEVIDGKFTRSFELAAVERDGNDDLASSGTTDNGARYVTVTVSWDSEDISLTSLLTNIYDI